MNYKIALEKYKPDYFLYENNKSAAPPIKEEIAKLLGVDRFSVEDNGVRMTYINSSLVSAQNRERFYVTNFGDIEQPQDRGVLVNDILDDGFTDRDKAYCLKHQAGNARDYFKKHHTQVKFEPVGVGYRNRREDDGKLYRRFETGGAPKTNALTTVRTDSMVAIPVMNTSPTQVGALPRPNGELSTSQAFRIYDSNSKGVTIKACGGGAGGKTGLYAIPVNDTTDHKSQTIKAQYSKTSVANVVGYTSTYGATGCAESVPVYATPCEWDENGKPTKAISGADGKIYIVYEVVDKQITIKGRLYPINLPDGLYIIRKLSVNECKRLQTVPDWYEFPVSDTQSYKLLGNGWTIEVIKHLLSHIPNIENEEIEVLSMYDGMSCGQIALKEMGCNVVRYFATEIDKYAIETTQHNFPNTIQLGDAFQVRDDDFINRLS